MGSKWLYSVFSVLKADLPSVQLSSGTHSCPNFMTPWTATCQASLSLTNSQSLLKHVSIKSVMASNHLILWRPLILPPSIFPSIRGSSNESVLHIRWPKYWSFSFTISPSSEYSGLIFFRIHWFDLPAVQFPKVHFLYIGKCKRLGSLKFFWYVPQLSGASFRVFISWDSLELKIGRSCNLIAAR